MISSLLFLCFHLCVTLHGESVETRKRGFNTQATRYIYLFSLYILFSKYRLHDDIRGHNFFDISCINNYDKTFKENSSDNIAWSILGKQELTKLRGLFPSSTTATFRPAFLIKILYLVILCS